MIDDYESGAVGGMINGKGNRSYYYYYYYYYYY
jgi:hypothetical protein